MYIIGGAVDRGGAGRPLSQAVNWQIFAGFLLVFQQNI